MPTGRQASRPVAGVQVGCVLIASIFSAKEGRSSIDSEGVLRFEEKEENVKYPSLSVGKAEDFWGVLKGAWSLWS